MHLCLTNQTERTVGPFEVYIASGFSGDDSCVMLNGLQKLVSKWIDRFIVYVILFDSLFV